MVEPVALGMVLSEVFTSGGRQARRVSEALEGCRRDKGACGRAGSLLGDRKQVQLRLLQGLSS